jgi:hypothetical protein
LNKIKQDMFAITIRTYHDFCETNHSYRKFSKKMMITSDFITNNLINLQLTVYCQPLIMLNNGLPILEKREAVLSMNAFIGNPFLNKSGSRAILTLKIPTLKKVLGSS